MSHGGSWAGIAESGSLAWLFILRGFYRTFGRRASVALLRPIVAYFFVTGRASRPASLDYLRTLWSTPRGREALGEPPGLRHVFRHLHSFAENLLDRMILWSGDEESITIADHGREHLEALVRAGRGGILLSSHIGSFDMLRALSAQTGIKLNVLMFTRHAVRINSFFERLQSGRNLRLIRFEPGTLDAAFEMRAAIARGEFVGILGDRVWPSEQDRTVEVSFLGRPARLPLGPFLLQGVLGCAMLYTSCIRTGPGRYTATTRVFAPEGAVPRAEREKHAEQLVQKFAGILEDGCVEAPYQWFNFFPFWGERARAPRALVRALALALAAVIGSGCAAGRSATQTARGWLGMETRAPRAYYAGAARAKLYRAPDATSAVVGQLALHEGVLCYELDGDFCYVKAERSGNEGWVLNADLIDRLPRASAPARNVAAPAAPAPEPEPELEPEPDAPAPAEKSVFDPY